ncbi:hypothetical protein ACWDYH_00205 [Nocardia goodfellowii]
MSGIVSRNLKAVEAGIGAILMVGTLFLSIGDVLPDSIAAGLASFLGLLTVARVWLAKNADLIADAEEAVEDLVDGTVGAFQIRG